MKISFGFFAFILTFASLQVVAQDNSYEALAKMFSQSAPTGTARFQAIGGSHSALGADISSAAGNPAGLGFYTRSEFSFTPGYQSASNSSIYAIEPSRTTNSNVNNFNIANIGVVFGGAEPQYREGWRGSFSISYSRQNTLYNNLSFAGNGAGSSITDSYAEALNRQVTYDAVYNPNPLTPSDLLYALNNNAPNNFGGTSSMNYWGYLVTATNNTANPFVGAEPNAKVNQSFNFQSTGRVSQWTLAYGGTSDEKFYIGGSLGIPSYHYETVKNYTENFQSYQEIKGFTDSRLLTSSGTGINLTVGTIYKPNDMIRFGLSVVTPTWYDVDETSSSAKVINVDETKGIDLGTNPDQNILNKLVSIGYKVAQRNNVYYITSIPRLSTVTYEDNYQLRTPFKANGGVALFFKKKGFVSADIEYVAYKGMNVSTANPDSEIIGDLENSAANIKLFYNNVLNVKVGGEYRVGNVSLRGGFNYMPTPYSTNFDNSKSIDRSQKIYSAGLGYRTNEFYIDVTGMYGTTQQSFTPYSLANSGDYASAKIDNSYVKGLVSFGIFF
ncbi:hypothetical protein VB796_14500 [Arcicella sp. LKC2W]|uniref:hypothetical protein n=1 Tax=Arcicella sp. LKC2W TaxID=2984198 RepID=UPI002B2103B1|nr:hypothetical protein [Arcicella sp. LKC2W]MEA5460264.1 hypothetical protein [Arcicella sp. LKC2W]